MGDEHPTAEQLAAMHSFTASLADGSMQCGKHVLHDLVAIHRGTRASTSPELGTRSNDRQRAIPEAEGILSPDVAM